MKMFYRKSQGPEVTAENEEEETETIEEAVHPETTQGIEKGIDVEQTDPGIIDHQEDVPDLHDLLSNEDKGADHPIVGVVVVDLDLLLDQ
jgi:hypothetical protein